MKELYRTPPLRSGEYISPLLREEGLGVVDKLLTKYTLAEEINPS